MSPIQLTHVGELLVMEMFERETDVRRLVGARLGRDVGSMRAIREAPLGRCGDLRFDGASRIDVGLIDETGRRCVACESKLGTDRMSGRMFEERFLEQCSTSHGDTRVSGSVPAILERKLPPACASAPLKARLRDVEYTIEEPWLLIVRRAIADRWAKRGRPGLSERCTIVAFEDLVAEYGGQVAFDALVRELLTFDYFDAWLG